MGDAFSWVPWYIYHDMGGTFVSNGRIICEVFGRSAEELAANARLIADAPDHALVAKAMALCVARWEPLISKEHGELCFGGIRYSGDLDEFGVPKLSELTRPRLLAALAKAEGR